MEYKLDLSSLEKVITSLENALTEYSKNPNEFVRDACIQRFEFVYDLSHKMLKRYLKISSPNKEEIDNMSFSDIIRTGAKQNILESSWDIWKLYRESRNKTSHTYDEDMAIDVFEITPKMLIEAKYLLKELKRLNSD